MSHTTLVSVDTLFLLCILNNLLNGLADRNADIFCGRARDRGCVMGSAAETTTQNLLVAGEVVRTLNLFDLKAAILAILRATILKDHHRTDRVRALCIGNIVALDTLRR